MKRLFLLLLVWGIEAGILFMVYQGFRSYSVLWLRVLQVN